LDLGVANKSGSNLIEIENNYQPNL